MWKAVLAGSTALVIAGSSLVYAQQRQGAQGAQRWRPNVADMQAFSDARLAALKAGLELTPDQERNWPAYETARKEMAKLRLDRMSAFMARRRGGDQANNGQPNGGQANGGQANGGQASGGQANGNQAQSNDPIDRMRQRGIRMSQTGDALKKLADATDPLYKSLNDSQKRRFAMLNREGGHRMGRPGEGRGRGEFRGRDGGHGRFRGREGGDGQRRFDRGQRRTEGGSGGHQQFGSRGGPGEENL